MVNAGELYPWVKTIHVSLAICSGSLFTVRGLGVLWGSPLPLAPRVRHLSQLVDTGLLLAALVLLALLQLNPFATPWLQAKLGLLVAYIVLGMYALHRAPTRMWRALAFAGALACFASIVLIAVAHDPRAILHPFTR